MICHYHFESAWHPLQAELQKRANRTNQLVLFFSAGANFLAILGHFCCILAILGHFWAILGKFRSFLGHFWCYFLWKNMPLCYLNRFLQLCKYGGAAKREEQRKFHNQRIAAESCCKYCRLARAHLYNQWLAKWVLEKAASRCRTHFVVVVF